MDLFENAAAFGALLRFNRQSKLQKHLSAQCEIHFFSFRDAYTNT